MKSKNHKKPLFFVVGFLLITTVAIVLNARAHPNRDVLGCHAEGYNISVNASEIEVEASGNYTMEVIGTGTDIVIDVYAGAKHNDLFNILPNNIIADNSPDDLNPAVNSIRVNLLLIQWFPFGIVHHIPSQIHIDFAGNDNRRPIF